VVTDAVRAFEIFAYPPQGVPTLLPRQKMTAAILNEIRLSALM
jgi:hypothetical protein